MKLAISSSIIESNLTLFQMSTMDSNARSKYVADRKALNEQFVSRLRDCLASSAADDFRPVCQSYSKQLAELIKEFEEKQREPTKNEASTANTLPKPTFPTLTTTLPGGIQLVGAKGLRVVEGSAIPSFTFGENYAQQSASAPRAGGKITSNVSSERRLPFNLPAQDTSSGEKTRKDPPANSQSLLEMNNSPKFSMPVVPPVPTTSSDSSTTTGIASKAAATVAPFAIGTSAKDAPSTVIFATSVAEIKFPSPPTTTTSSGFSFGTDSSAKPFTTPSSGIFSFGAPSAGSNASGTSKFVFGSSAG